jgi:hypothetical protein
MNATLHVLRPQTPPIAGYLRVGHTGHRKLAELQASGRLPYRRFVFDAAHLQEQGELAKTLKSSGCEVVLDPNFAEMATRGRFGSSTIQSLPWSNLDRPWEPTDFGQRRNHDTAVSIAEFAVGARVSVVLAPSHLIETRNDPWRSTDLLLCEELRHELDHRGGADIAIDYQLITTMAQLKDESARRQFVANIRDLPIQNVWIRASGFGATATGAGTRHFIESLRDLHAIGRPLVADMAGGFAALGSAAFGAVGGISHGVGQKESFAANDWRTPPTGGGGASARVYVHELDRYLKEEQLEAIFGAKGGRSRFACADTSCCPHGSEDMIENGHVHFLIQRHRQLDDLSSVPEDRRTGHFLLRHIDPAIRTARHAGTLKIQDERVRDVLAKAKKRLVRLRDALADLDAQETSETRSRSPAFRGGSPVLSAVLGR